MALITLERAKQHLNVLYSDDDALIGAYIDAAESIIGEYLDRAVVAEGVSLPTDTFAMTVTPAIAAAILLMVALLYENRELTEWADQAVLPRSVRALLAPWRVWRLADEEVA